MARAKAISIPITGNSAPLRKSLKEAQKDLTAFGKAQQSWAKASTIGYAVAGSAALGFAKDVISAAASDEKSQKMLARQLEVTVGATAAVQKQTSSYIDTLMYATNVSDDQLRPALAALVRVTGDVKKAQGLLGLAIDVSAGSGKDLESVVTALSKAAMGQTSALARLGLGLSSATTKSGSLKAVTDELQLKFSGAAAAAVDTTAGRIQNLNIRFDELKETIGYKLLPFVDEATKKLADFASAAQSGNVEKTAKASGNLAVGIANFGQKLTGVDFAVGFFKSLAFWADKADKAVAASGDTAEASAAKFRQMDAILSLLPPQYEEMRKRGEGYQKAVQDYLDSKAEEKYKAIVDAKAAAMQKAADAAARNRQQMADAKAQYKETAKTLKDDLNKALEDSKIKLKDAQDAAKAFGDQFAYSFGVSLAGAYDTATTSEQNYTDALAARKDAYAALDVAKQGTDLNAYLKAVQDVQAAEEGVTKAQAARITPAAAFADQIKAAKDFGPNLKTLLGSPYNLGQAGLQQLLDLGPAAGAQVTKALLEGTAGFSVGDLNSSLADLAGVQAGLSTAVTGALGGSYNAAVSAAQGNVDALSSASIGAPGVGQGFVININTGVGDPIEIGRQVQAILTQYDNRAGKATIQGPKKKAKV